MAYLGMPDLAVYKRALRSNVAMWYTVDAFREGVPVPGATGLQPVGGTIVDTAKPGVRRTLNLELVGTREIPSTDLYDLLEPIGTTLTVTAHVRYTNRSVVDIPMGLFDVDSQRISEGDGQISLTAPDQWAKIQRYRFLSPVPSGNSLGLTVVQQISDLVLGAIDWDGDLNIFTDDATTVPPLVWEKDRDQAIIKLAESIGCWVYFDRLGVPTIAPIPSGAGTADWLVDSGENGVMVDLDRERSRTETRNVVVVSSSAADGEKFPVQYVWDDNPFSPTYAGTDPIFNPGSAGPFGIVSYFYDTPILSTVDAARTAGRTILARVSGLASQISASAVPNPAIDAFDSMEIVTPGISRLAITGYTAGSGLGAMPLGTGPLGSGSAGVPVLVRSTDGVVIEHHTVDTVTHPLTVGPALHIDGRSTRAEEIEGGS